MRSIGLAALVIVVVGAPNFAERVISIWSHEYRTSFPVIPAAAIIVGGGLLCVLLLLLVEPLLEKRSRSKDE